MQFFSHLVTFISKFDNINFGIKNKWNLISYLQLYTFLEPIAGGDTRNEIGVTSDNLFGMSMVSFPEQRLVIKPKAYKPLL